MNTVARFEIEYTQLIDSCGNAVAPLPAFAHDPERLIALYRALALTRIFDSKAVALQRTGQLGTFPSSLGQEAVSVGVGSAMRAEDVLLPTYREQGAQLVRGVRIEELLLYWSGDEAGSAFSGPRQDFPICVPIGTHACHAVGIAYALKLRREPRVAVCVLGDGGTSKGDFYEAINAAGIWSLPVVFVVANNEWAISVPRLRQSAAETLAQKAIAAGIPGCQVDGNDVIAVHHVVSEALAEAREGRGPALIEALTYRLSDHTTADDATRYRDFETVNQRWRHEPIARLRNFLVARGRWDSAREERLLAECAEHVQAAVDAYLATPPPEPGTMFDYLYAALPKELIEQRAAATAAEQGDG